MKTNNNIFFILIFFSFISIGVNGQNSKARPEWYLSKDVQRISNRTYFERLSESQLTIKSLGYPNWIVSKAVARIGSPNERVSASGNIVSMGYPYWTISKGIDQVRK
jgi:hypothetical protein